MTLKNAVTKGVKAWRDRRVGYWLCIDPKTGEYYLLTSANLAELNGFKAMYRLPAVYYRVVVRVHKATESIEVYFGMERNGLISALEVGGDHFEAGLEYYRRETRPATEAEENVIILTLNYRNDAH